MIAKNPEFLQDSASPDEVASDPRRLSDFTDDTSAASEDTLGAYLSQIGAIPLLTRDQEIELAKAVELHRGQFRRLMLESDFVLREATNLLRQVHNRELPFDRTIEVSVSDHQEKHQILGRLSHNLSTLEVLLEQNQKDYDAAIKTASPRRRRALWWRLVRRRRRAVRLVEELGLRLKYLEQHLETLEHYEQRTRELQIEIETTGRGRQDDDSSDSAAAQTQQAAQTQLAAILREVQQTPAGLTRQVRRLRVQRARYEHPNADFAKATCVWWSRSPRSTAIAVSVCWT